MSDGIGDQAAAIAAAIKAGSAAFATIDPGAAASNRPCFLVSAPTISWTSGTIRGVPEVTWRVIALASKTTGSVDALNELDGLMEEFVKVYPPERADPGKYPVGAEQVPCYVVTFTTL